MDAPTLSLRLSGVGLEIDVANIGGVYFWTQRDYNNLLQQIATIQLQLNQILSSVQANKASLTTLQTQERNIMAALDDLQTQVQANTNLEQSAITLIQGLAKQITDAVNSNDSSALAALAGQLNTSAAALGAAIAANTPQAPTPAPAPDPNAPQVNPLHTGAHGR
jgi:chromosome segregation ATPase